MGWAFHNRINKDGSQAVVYQVYYNGETFSISTGVKTKKTTRFNGKVKGDLNATLKLSHIQTIILTSVQSAKSKLPYWTKNQLKSHIELLMQGHVVEEGKMRIYLFEFWSKRVVDYKKAGKFDSVQHNLNSQKAVFSILDKNIYLDEINKRHLRLLVEGLSINRSPSTVNGYMRDLRALINMALSDEIISTNPFFGFRLPTPRLKGQVALELDELRLFANAQIVTKHQELVRDMAMFRYYCLGMRIKDQVLLTHDNLKNDVLKYTTSKNKKEFEFRLSQEAIDIVNKWKCKNYLFPVLKTKLDNEALQYKMSLVRKSHSQALNKIAKKIGIDKKISTHTFRHTFNYINDQLTLKERQTALGHSSQSTTEKYNQRMPNFDHLITQIRK